MRAAFHPPNQRIIIELISDFNYYEGMAISASRKGARTLNTVPAEVLRGLHAGEIETVNLMEWLAADMRQLGRSVAKAHPGLIGVALTTAADAISDEGVTFRLKAFGEAIARGVGVDGEHFETLATHRCDIVRQWACYAANDEAAPRSTSERLSATIRYANDPNMSVRETAWMAFRPHLAADVEKGLALLLPLTQSAEANVRRFAIEVSRPRSVWGAHLAELKRDPHLAAPLLEAVMDDGSRYVQLAAGNWLNDASKSRPDWVRAFCSKWSGADNKHTQFIIKRGCRTLSREEVRRGRKSRVSNRIIGEAA